MKEIEAIRNHPVYAEYYDKLKKAEAKRRFCRHQIEHFLDVARIAYIINLEDGMGIRKEVIYAAALLHDIGKYRQYKEDVPHEEASARIAGVILEELPERYFSKEEKKEILRAILGHRKERADMGKLERLIYVGDKRSRNCFACESEEECSWSAAKKNMEIEI